MSPAEEDSPSIVKKSVTNHSALMTAARISSSGSTAMRSASENNWGGRGV